jgi:energy-coupling factor transporter ATP-binding protein EcfA2
LGGRFGLDSLSAAERRWCLIAIRLAATGADLILLDEPERGLHLRAQRNLGQGLRQMSKEMDCPVIVSSHSPEILRDSENRLVHVTRNTEGNVRTHTMTAPARENLDEMGLEPVDVLQLTERFVIVEGLHDEIALDVFLGDHLADLRAVVLPMRGATNLASTVDSQFLWDFTSAGVVIVLDNTRAELARQMLSDLHRAVVTRIRKQSAVCLTVGSLKRVRG